MGRHLSRGIVYGRLARDARTGSNPLELMLLVRGVVLSLLDDGHSVPAAVEYQPSYFGPLIVLAKLHSKSCDE
jgi:hypothetical protein